MGCTRIVLDITFLFGIPKNEFETKVLWEYFNHTASPLLFLSLYSHPNWVSPISPHAEICHPAEWPSAPRRSLITWASLININVTMLLYLFKPVCHRRERKKVSLCNTHTFFFFPPLLPEGLACVTSKFFFSHFQSRLSSPSCCYLLLM